MPRSVPLGGFLLALIGCGSPPASLSDGPANDAQPPALDDAGLTEAIDAAVDASPGHPDIAVDLGRAQIDLSIAEEDFAVDSCELHPSEQCVGAPGIRRVLRFSVETANLGDADLVIGDPTTNPNYSYSQCHQHYHFSGYAQYRLLDDTGSEVVTGRKQAFCLLDSEPYAAGAALSPHYSCFNQGLQKGWVDVYEASLPCQFLDITDVPDGNYQLEVVANPDGVLDDSSTLNNTQSIDITIGDVNLTTPTETCPALAARYRNRLERECDWQLAGEFDCTPGSPTSVGCSQQCSQGSCTGDPMLRVCDADTPNCTSALAIAANDDRCGGQCPLVNSFFCPSSGRLAVYTAAVDPNQPYTCNIALGTSGL